MRPALLLVLVAACGGDDTVHHLPDGPACVAMPSLVAIEAPTTYTCHESFKSKVTISNQSCEPMTVSAVKLTPMVTNGACAPSGIGNYMPMTMMLAPSESAVVLDLTTRPFCCTSPGCPSSFQCDEAFTFDVTTDKGVFSGTTVAHLGLDSCTEVCP